MSVLCGTCNHVVDSPDDAICVNCCRKSAIESPLKVTRDHILNRIKQAAWYLQDYPEAKRASHVIGVFLDALSFTHEERTDIIRAVWKKKT